MASCLIAKQCHFIVTLCHAYPLHTCTHTQQLVSVTLLNLKRKKDSSPFKIKTTCTSRKLTPHGAIYIPNIICIRRYSAK